MTTLQANDWTNANVKPLRVAMCQVETRPWEIEYNLHNTIKALETAAAQGATLAITPECVLHGYPEFTSQEDIQRMRDAAEPLDGERIGALQCLARRLTMNIVFGFAEKGTDGGVHNSAAFINSKGDTVDIYRKVHCRNFESSRYSGAYEPGDSFVTVDIDHNGATYRLGLIICFDREVPESIRCLRANGVHLVICPLATDTFDMHGDEKDGRINNEVLTRCRAVENEVFIAVVNHATRYNGGSYIVDPTGNCLKRLGNQPEVSVVDVPLWKAAEMHRTPLSWMGWGYRRPDVYVDYLT